MIEYRIEKPSLCGYRALYECTGWVIPLPPDTVLSRALDNTWHCVTAFDNGKAVGVGRLISDEALYALLADLIVLPEYRHQGVGTAMLRILKDAALAAGLRRLWLIAAPGKVDFYARNGFSVRPESAPGMQMNDL